MAPSLSYCVVNTNGRDHLLACLAAIRDTHPADVEHEILVLDNASDDGSAEAVRGLEIDVRLIERTTRAGKAENDTTLLREARGELCLLLNEDAELRPGAAAALLQELGRHEDAAIAGAQLVNPEGEPQPCAWRLPSVWTALAGALFLHRLFSVQSGGDATREVGWVQSSAMLVRRAAAEQVGYLDPDFFVYSDETDFAKRLHDAGWRVLHVPSARAVHHEQLATDPHTGEHRIVEFHRNRDLYMRKHHGPAAAGLVRALTAWSYAARSVAAVVLSGHDPGWYRLHARQALRPDRGEGLREAAEDYNATRATLNRI